MAVRRLKAIITAVDNASPTLRAVSASLGALGALAVAVGVGQLGRALVRGMVDATRAAGVQERAERLLQTALENTGQSVGRVLPELRAYAATMQDLTGVGDELILENQALLVSIGQLRGEGLERATRAALDLAAATGVNTRTAFELIAKAAAGYTGTLARYGIIVDQTTDQSERFREALETIEKQFGGAAEKQLQTFSGRVQELEGRLGDLKEALGAPLREVATAFFADVLSPGIKNLTDATNETTAYRSAVLELSLVLATLGRELEQIVVMLDLKGLLADRVVELHNFRRTVDEAPSALGRFATAVGSWLNPLFGAQAGLLGAAGAVSELDQAARGGPLLFDNVIKSIEALLRKTPKVEEAAEDVELTLDELMAKIFSGPIELDLSKVKLGKLRSERLRVDELVDTDITAIVRANQKRLELEREFGSRIVAARLAELDALAAGEILAATQTGGDVAAARLDAYERYGVRIEELEREQLAARHAEERRQAEELGANLVELRRAQLAEVDALEADFRNRRVEAYEADLERISEIEERIIQGSLSMVDTLSSAISNQLGAVVFEHKRASDAIEQIYRALGMKLIDLFLDFIAEQIKKAMLNALGNLFLGAASGGGGGFVVSGFAGMMAHGGIVPETSGLPGGGVPILAHPGEAVLPRELTELLVEQAGRGASGAGVTLNVQGDVIDPAEWFNRNHAELAAALARGGLMGTL